MIRFVSPAILVAAALTVTAASPQQLTSQQRQQEKLTKRLDGLVAGKPVNCLPRDRVTDVKGYNGTILYIQGKNTVWRNDTGGGCEGLGRNDDILVSRSSMGQYCSGDIIETRSRTGLHFTGVCSLGEFTPYTRGH